MTVNVPGRFTSNRMTQVLDLWLSICIEVRRPSQTVWKAKTNLKFECWTCRYPFSYLDLLYIIDGWCCSLTSVSEQKTCALEDCYGSLQTCCWSPVTIGKRLFRCICYLNDTAHTSPLTYYSSVWQCMAVGSDKKLSILHVVVIRQYK